MCTLRLSFALLAALGASGAETCAWLNAATAEGILGAAVTLSVPSGGVCKFAAAAADLTIGVVTSQHPKVSCEPSPLSLKAIGNEAVLCNQSATSAQVVGRVRDRVFTITVHSGEAAADKATTAAEHVAGNLF